MCAAGAACNIRFVPRSHVHDFAYFMIRARRAPGMPGIPTALSGRLEDLGTGETRDFCSGSELLEELFRLSPNPAAPPPARPDAPGGSP